VSGAAPGDGGPPAPRVYWHPPRAGVWAPIWGLGCVLLQPTLPWLVGFRVAGRRRIPREGGVLVVANHMADTDPPFLCMAVVPRRAQYLALARHFTFWPLATLLFALGAFPVRTGQPDPRAIRYARNQLAAGRLVIIFPEGAPTWGEGLGEFREGVGVLGLTPGVTVIPAAIWGSHRVMRGWRVVGRGPVLVAFGRPVPVPAEGSRRERAAELTRRARAAVAELLEPIVRAHP
jgi:1-acyl-sn-glycerol-3-phosphate acyltransferase